jgi:hypothetical protein
MKRRDFLVWSLFTPLAFVSVSRTGDPDALEVAINSLLNSMFVPLEQLGNNIDRARYLKELRALGDSIDRLLHKKKRMAHLLVQKPLVRAEVENLAAGISPDVEKLSEDILRLSFGLRAQFKDQGSQVANSLRKAIVEKSWITTVKCCARNMSDGELVEAAEAAKTSVKTLEQVVKAVSDLHTTTGG